MPRKKKLEQLNQIDGKKEDFKPAKLSQLFGDNGLWKYNTMEEEVYKKQLKGMNLSDLRRHAVKIGLVPNKERERLEKQLVIEFRKHTNLYKPPQNPHKPTDIPKDKLQQALDIMSAVK